jgi:hypothetical protein
MSTLGSVALQILQSNSRQDSLMSIITGGGGTSTTSAQSIAALRQAQSNQDREVAAKADDPLVRRELERFFERVRNAESVEEVLDDPIARKVFLTANGLGDFANAPGMVKKALTADLSDKSSLPYKLQDSNPAWLDTAEAYNFHDSGLAALKDNEALAAIGDAYAEVRWREDLEARAPGLSYALTFINNGGNLEDSLQVLGSGYAREVISTAFGIPKETARQSLQTQMKNIDDRVNFDRMSDASYREDIARRYLIALAGNGSGGFANTSA